MKALELPIGAKFTLPPDDTIFTVTRQITGATPIAHLTYVRFFDKWCKCEATSALAGHTEVTHPPQSFGVATQDAQFAKAVDATCSPTAKRIAELERENTTLREKVALLDNPHALHVHCVRNLTDAQVAHLFGERMTEIQNDRTVLRQALDVMKAEAAKDDAAIRELREENTRLTKQWEEYVSTHNAQLTAAWDERDKLRTENASLRIDLQDCQEIIHNITTVLDEHGCSHIEGAEAPLLCNRVMRLAHRAERRESQNAGLQADKVFKLVADNAALRESYGKKEIAYIDEVARADRVEAENAALRAQLENAQLFERYAQQFGDYRKSFNVRAALAQKGTP